MLGGMWKEVKFAGEAPCARSQHATCLSEDKKSIYVFGGQAHSKAYNDLWRFDVASSSWEKLEGNGAPESRWGGSLTEHKGVLYLFGGEQVSSADYEHLLGYNLAEKKWFTPSQTGTAPSPRSNHSATVVPLTGGGNGIFVYAGKCNSSSRELADAFVLNLDTMEWYNPYYKIRGSVPDEIPPNRKRHSACLYNNQLLIFAGWQGNRNAGDTWDDFYSLDLDTMEWSNPSTRGTGPKARAGHASAIVNDKMFVWGGWGSAGRGNFGELNYIELDDWTWNGYRRGKPPAERFDFGYVLIGDKLYVFGGQLDPQSKEYTNEMWVANLGAVY